MWHIKINIYLALKPRKCYSIVLLTGYRNREWYLTCHEVWKIYLSLKRDISSTHCDFKLYIKIALLLRVKQMTHQVSCFSKHRSKHTHKGQICFPIIIRKLILIRPCFSFLGGHRIPVSHMPSTLHSALWQPKWIWVRPVLELLILFLRSETITKSWAEQCNSSGLPKINK